MSYHNMKGYQQAQRNILVSALMVCASIIGLTAQEAGYFSHHYFQPVLINPGATGFEGDHQVLGSYKLNFTDFDNAPRSFTALYHGSFAEKIGLGIQLTSDKVGAAQVFEGQLNYAYRFAFDDAVISVGLSTGLQTFKIKDTQNDPLIDPNDPLLNEAIDGYMLFDGSAGVYGEVDEKLFFGVSFPNLVKNRLSDINGDVNLDDLDGLSYAVLVGYKFNIKNYDFTVEPSLTFMDLRYSPFLVDANLRFSFLDEQLVGGIGYSIGDNSRASLLLGTRINALRLYYSYDVSLGDFQQYNNGTHEFTMLYRIPRKAVAAPEVMQ
jgi:type IX secretion system PorP/SprF family membrane protein